MARKQRTFDYQPLVSGDALPPQDPCYTKAEIIDIAKYIRQQQIKPHWVVIGDLAVALTTFFEHADPARSSIRLTALRDLAAELGIPIDQLRKHRYASQAFPPDHSARHLPFTKARTLCFVRDESLCAELVARAIEGRSVRKLEAEIALRLCAQCCEPLSHTASLLFVTDGREKFWFHNWECCAQYILECANYKRQSQF